MTRDFKIPGKAPQGLIAGVICLESIRGRGEKVTGEEGRILPLISFLSHLKF